MSVFPVLSVFKPTVIIYLHPPEIRTDRCIHIIKTAQRQSGQSSRTLVEYRTKIFISNCYLFFCLVYRQTAVQGIRLIIECPASLYPVLVIRYAIIFRKHPFSLERFKLKSNKIFFAVIHFCPERNPETHRTKRRQLQVKFTLLYLHPIFFQLPALPIMGHIRKTQIVH